MLKTVTYQMSQPLEEKLIKKVIYMIQNHTIVKKVDIEPVERKELFISILNCDDEVSVFKDIDRIISKSREEMHNEENPPEQKPIQFNMHSNSNSVDISHELIEKGWVVLLRNGEIGYSQILIELMKYIDQSLIKLFAPLNINHWREYQALIPFSYLDQIGYLEHMPEAMFSLNSEHLKGGENMALQTAPCFKIYFELENQQIEQNRIYTVIGPCYRNERGRAYLFETLTCFRMREFVFVGTKEHVLQGKEKALDLSIKWLQQLGMSGGTYFADDPFFITSNSRENSEIPEQIKYEVRCPIPGRGKDISIGSYDIHGDFFSQSFSIKSGFDSNVWTGCMGYGIERCLWAFLQQHGLQLKNWPEEVQKAMKYYEQI